MRERTKQRLARLARDFHVLNGIDFLLYLRDRARWRGSNRRFARSHPGFIAPPAPLAFDAFGYTSHEAYLESGLEHARYIAEIARDHASPSGLRVLEWGCGPGRIIRHLPGLLGDQAAEVAGVDLSAKTIEWCRASIPGIRFERNELQPPLPFANGAFGFVYAISVFTHLDEAAWTRWMHELGRVMTEDGVLLFTTHGQHYLPKLLADEAELFTTGRPVFRAKIDQGKKRFTAFHPPEFVRGHLPDGFRVLWHTESPDVPGLKQDVWLVTRSGPER